MKENNGDIESPAGRAVDALNRAMIALERHIQPNSELASRVEDMFVNQTTRNTQTPGVESTQVSKLDPQYGRIVNQQIASAQKLIQQYDAGQESQSLINMAETLRTSLPKVNDYLRKNSPSDPRIQTIDELLNGLLRVEISFKYLGRQITPRQNA